MSTGILRIRNELVRHHVSYLALRICFCVVVICVGIVAIAKAATTYSFEDDTVNQSPANVTVTAGTFNVVNDGDLGKSLKALTQTGVIAAANFTQFASSSDYTVTWKQSYTDALGRGGFTLRAQEADTNVANSAGAKLGYLFHVYSSNSVYIWKVGSSSYTSLWSGSLPKNKPRWFKAIVQGTTLGFYYSNDGTSYTLLATTTDSTYASGFVQYTAGYGTAVNNDVIDDIVITPSIAIAGADSVSGAAGVGIPVTGLQIVGATTTVPVKLLVTNGTLAMSVTNGLTFNGPSTGSTIYFSGSPTDVNNALASLTYTRGAAGSDTLEVSLVGSGEVFFSGTGNLYEYVSSTLTWTDAKTAAESRSKYGAIGYLTTITSQAENDFVAARLANAGWMGASDAAVENDWKWVTGPENNVSFWSGTSGGSTVNGNYANWGTGEPNNAGNEDCAQFLAGGSGKWNDLPCSSTTLPGYVVEYGAPGAQPTVVAKNIAITTVNAPTVNSLSPADNATGVALTTNIAVTFSTTVATGTGSFLIRKTSDDSLVETIEATSTRLTKSGNTFTIDPAITFDEGAGYYIQIGTSTVYNPSGALYYAGISSASTWNFTTLDATAPLLSNVTASTTASTTAVISWTTNENASTRVNYGVTGLRGVNSSETDTSPRVTSHTRIITEFIPCTKYYYVAVSTDGFSNTATSTENTFTTPGCVASEIPMIATSTSITSASGGNSSLTRENATITVTAPSNFTSTSSSVVIQVQALSSAPILSSLGRPSGVTNEVGTVVFDVKAIIDSTTILDSFDHPVTITYTYSDGDIIGLNESTLWLYHYHANAWSRLDSCSVDTGTNTITCTTPSFSIFSLFGNATVASSMSGGSGWMRTCKDSRAANYNDSLVSMHDGTLCLYSASLPVVVTQASSPVEVTTTLMDGGRREVISKDVRDLKRGMQGEDVKMLQELLMKRGYSIPAGATGYFLGQTHAALSKYQKDKNISPAAGYFGSITRTHMKQESVLGIWW